MPAAQTMTAAEYLELPAELHRRGTQLVAGEVVVHEPLPLHQIVARDLLLALAAYCRAAPGRGTAMLPLDVRLDELNVYAPDVLWYSEGRAPGRDAGRPSPIPDIAVEVRSPSTWRRDLGAKKLVYERRGLPELWLVDTRSRSVIALRRSRRDGARYDIALEFAGEDALTSPQLPGFELPMADVFGD